MFTRIFAALALGVAWLTGAFPALATDIYVTPTRGLTPRTNAIGEVSVKLGHFAGYGTVDIAGESGIGFIRLRVPGERDPLIVYIAYPLIVSGDGSAITLTCSPKPRATPTWGSCEGGANDSLLSGADTVNVLVQRIEIRGSAVLITHQIERISASTP